MAKAPKVAVFKFASCDGCQLSLLELEDELLTLTERIDFAHFPEATRRSLAGPYDITLVEGSITTAHDLTRIREVREISKKLITIGACATAGGIQALRNFRNVDSMVSAIYAQPAFIDTLATSTPIAAHVPVDYELRGCPVNKHQLLEVLSALLAGRTPRISPHPVCFECKRSLTPCLLVSGQVPCLGPVTHGGCDALCPRYGRGCYGCYGPTQDARTGPLSDQLVTLGLSSPDLVRLFRSFNAEAPAFKREGLRHE